MAGRRSLALIALLGCVLAGCSDAASDDPAPTPTESPTSSERDVIASVPTLPPAARKDTLKGAEAFIRHYIELLNYAANTGDVRALHRAARGCGGCRKYETLYRDTYARGGYMKEPGWQPSEVFAAVQGDGSVGVLTTVRAPRMRFKLRAGAEEKVGKQDTYKLRFELRSFSGRWVVTDFGQQEEIDKH
ncbi:DUF6318 family protein [Nocardioidaceae bacterium SCSIO 66511]|nr:DUF6318 family protein [Nocardioidaceae bacterium SCSIO 66511]